MPGIKDMFKNLFSSDKDKLETKSSVPPMPDKSSIDNMFEELMEKLSMPTQTVEKMRQMTDEHKWLMICQNEKKTSFETPGEWVKILKSPANESTLQKFRVVITGVDVKWLKLFYEKEGLFHLAKNNLNSSQKEAEVIACLRAIRSFMNSNYGLKATVECEKIFAFFTYPLASSNEETLQLIFDLLTVISWVSVDGHKLVEKVLADNRDDRKERTVYSPAVRVLREKYPDWTKTSAMTFINSMINSIHNIEERNHNRNFLFDEHLLDIISDIKHSEMVHDDTDRDLLINQFQIFEKEVDNDKKETELLKINMSDSEAVWSFLLESAKENGQSAYLVDLLRYLLIIPSVRRLGQFIWSNCHSALYIATSFIVNDKEIDDLEANLDKIDENIDINDIVQKSFTADARLLKYGEIQRLMAKASKINKAAALEASSDEGLRKEFHDYKMQKEAEIDKLKKELSEGAKAAPPSSTAASEALPMAETAGAPLPPAIGGAAPPPLAGGDAIAPPPLAGGDAAAPPPLSGGIGAPPPLGGAGGPPPLGFGAPAAAYLPPKDNPAPAVKMKNLHWGIIPVEKIEGTVWDHIKDDSVKLNRAEFEDMFRAKAAAKMKTGGNAKPKKAHKEKVQLVDSKRSTNVEIALSRFKMSPEAIRDAILEMDESTLNADRIGKLLSLVPTNEEAEICGSYEGNLSDLGVTEKFFRVVSSINNISQRLESFLFKQQFEDQYGAIMDEIQAVKRSAAEIKSNANLKKILSVVLKAGNHMNGGTKKGGVYGFKLSTLKQINSTKSTDNKVTLMQYIVFYLSKEHPGTIRIVEELGFLGEVVKIESANLSAKVNKMKANLNRINSMIKKAGDDPKDRFKSVMGDFYNKAADKAAKMHKEMATITDQTQTLIEQYGEDKSTMKWEEFFKIFNDFVDSIKRSSEFWKRKAEEELKEKKNKQFAEQNKQRLAMMKSRKKESGATDNVLNNLKQTKAEEISQEILRRRKLVK